MGVWWFELWITFHFVFITKCKATISMTFGIPKPSIKFFIFYVVARMLLSWTMQLKIDTNNQNLHNFKKFVFYELKTLLP